MSGATAAQVLAALRTHHADAAIVPEVTIRDQDWLEHGDLRQATPTRRIDALMFRSLERTALEIKVTVADFERDHYQKRLPWMRVTHRFVYAVPAGLVLVAPHKCGLWWVHDDGRVEVRRRAVVNTTPEPLPQHVVQALAYRAARAVAI